MSEYRDQQWNETITVFHKVTIRDADGKTRTSWTKYVLHDCFFGVRVIRTLDGMTILSYDTFIVRMPVRPASAIVSVGDIIVRGLVDNTLADDDSGADVLRENVNRAFRVNRTRDNSQMELTAHYMASEE